MTNDLEDFLPQEPAKKALSFLNPWPYTILHMDKRIENRRESIVSSKNFDRTIWMHVSQDMSKSDELECLKFIEKIGLDPTQIPKREALVYGGIIAKFRITDVIVPGGKTTSGGPHPRAQDKWYMGFYGYVLEDVEPVPFIPCKGALSIWTIPKEVAVLL
jgi:hypothetical protein